MVVRADLVSCADRIPDMPTWQAPLVARRTLSIFGTHRRVRLVDVLEYRDRQDAIANVALENMVRQAEEHGLYD